MKRLVLIFAVLASSSTLAQALQCNAWGGCWETEDPDEEAYVGAIQRRYHYYQPQPNYYYQHHYYQPNYYYRHHQNEGWE